MAKEDANVADMSVHDKDNPSLGPTEEAQDVSALARVIVPMPAYTDPANPAGASGSINMDLDAHPVAHAEEYGAETESHSVTSPIDTFANDMADEGAEAGAGSANSPEDRDEWKKADWVARAKELGLSTSGNMDEVAGRVEALEALDEEYAAYNADDWKSDIAAADNADDLAELRAAYDRSEAEYSTVEAAFDAKSTELAQ